jgi:peptidyl-prolyl cis-trans isomerase C
VIRFVLLGLLSAILLSACASAPTRNTAAEVASADPSPLSTQPPDNTGLVARVNGVGISRLTFDLELARRSANFTANPDALAAQVLDGLIERELIRQAARELGLAATLDEARAEVQALKQTLATEAEWERYLQLNNMTEPEMVNAMLEQITSARVREHIFAPLYGDVPQANARHLLVATEAEASALLAQLQQGADFDTLVRTHSIDNATRDTGGDLGWFTPQELIDPRLAEVIFSLEPGSIAGPIPSRVGYHIVLLVALDTRPIEPERMGVVMEATYNQWLTQRLAAAAVERYR